MAGHTIDYKIQSRYPFEPNREYNNVSIPTEAKEIADRLLCEAQVAGILGRKINGFDEYISVPGIHDVLLEYGQRRVPLSLANDMIVLGVAEIMANNNPQYRDLLSGIVDASRVVCDRYNRDMFN